MPSLGRRVARTAVAVATTVTMSVGLMLGLSSGQSFASSHREAPLTSADPQIDSTDLYAFVTPKKPNSVTIISNWIPLEEPAGGPNFYAFAPGVHYDINIDNNGDAKPDIIYRWVFTNHTRNTDSFLYNTGQVTSLDDPDLNFYQTYDLYKIYQGHMNTLVSDAVVVPVRVGDASMPDYGQLFSDGVDAIRGGRTWAGQADDPFFLDLRVFDLLYGANFSEAGDDTLAGFNVHSFAIEVQKTQLEVGGDGSHILGIWTTAERQSTRVQYDDGSQQFSGNFVQVSRLGMPLVNEVVVPVGLKDRFNASKPVDDAQFAPKVETFGNDPNDLPALINALYGIPIPDSDPNTPGVQRDDLTQVFLTGIPGLNQPPSVTASEMLRLNDSIPPCAPQTCATYSRLGVIGGDNAGFPNGRRLSDDIIDASLQVVEGVLLGQDTGLSDGVDANDVHFQGTFPYLALPHSGSDPDPHTLTGKPLP
jgi:hypothetical protein